MQRAQRAPARGGGQLPLGVCGWQKHIDGCLCFSCRVVATHSDASGSLVSLAACPGLRCWKGVRAGNSVAIDGEPSSGPLVPCKAQLRQLTLPCELLLVSQALRQAQSWRNECGTTVRRKPSTSSPERCDGGW